MSMIFNSTEVLAGALVGLYRKVIEKKDSRNLEEALAIIIVSRLARAWKDSGVTWQAIPSAQQQLFYAAVLNIVRDVMMNDVKLTLERGLKDALEIDAALIVADMLSKAMMLTW